MKIARVSEMQNMDRMAIKQFHISEELLMENAGLSVYSIIDRKLKSLKNSFIVFCGIGNNGGDGLVIARKLHSTGTPVRICLLGNPDGFRAAALSNWQIIKKLEIPVFYNPEIDNLEDLVRENDVIIDAIFGTGLNREVSGYYYQIINFINNRNNIVISVDIPSGVNGNTAAINGIAVKANYTVTFGLPKIGNILYPGYNYGGKLFVSHISFPPALYCDEGLNININTVLPLPERQSDGHKGTFGNGLFIAGASNYYGAPYFAAMSFLKAGGGYSRLAAPSSIVPFLANKASEVVFLPQKETGQGTIALTAIDELINWSEKMDIVILGPGLSLNSETQVLARRLIKEIKKPLIIDGDGLTALSQDLSILSARSYPTILTPHLGELSALTKKSISELKKELLDITEDFSINYHTILIVKGAHSLIGLPTGEIFINMTGNSGMATAGSGDILTGTIASMYTLGLPVDMAVRQGTLIHGLSGDLAAEAKGMDGMTAQDILDYLPLAVLKVRKGLTGGNRYIFTGIEII